MVASSSQIYAVWNNMSGFAFSPLLSFVIIERGKIARLGNETNSQQPLYPIIYLPMLCDS
jgi:hypothetical protein